MNSSFILGFLLGSMSSTDRQPFESTEPYYPVRKIKSILDNDIRKTKIDGGWHISMITKLSVIDHVGDMIVQMATGTYLTYEDPGQIETVIKDNSVIHSCNGQMLLGISV